MKPIGELIRIHRLAKNMTQEELGNLVFVSKQAVSKWERGRTVPDIETVRKLCSVLNIDTAELFSEGDSESPIADEVTNTKAICSDYCAQSGTEGKSRWRMFFNYFFSFKRKNYMFKKYDTSFCHKCKNWMIAPDELYHPLCTLLLYTVTSLLTFAFWGVLFTFKGFFAATLLYLIPVCIFIFPKVLKAFIYTFFDWIPCKKEGIDFNYLKKRVRLNQFKKLYWCLMSFRWSSLIYLNYVNNYLAETHGMRIFELPLYQYIFTFFIIQIIVLFFRKPSFVIKYGNISMFIICSFFIVAYLALMVFFEPMDITINQTISFIVIGIQIYFILLSIYKQRV